MSLALKVNFKKGWPDPSIVEVVAAPHTGVTTLDQGMVGHQDATTNGWVLGVSAINQEPFIFRNAQWDPDAGRGPGIGLDTANQGTWNQVGLGGIQGISFQNPLLVQTVQYAGTPAVNDLLYAATDGKLKVGALAATPTVAADGARVLIAVVKKAAHSYQGLSYITVAPITSTAIA